MPVPGLRLRISLAASMPSRWKVGRHADVGDDHLGLVLGGAGDQLVVVGGLADDLEVGLTGEQRPHAGAHDQVVVGQDHGDHAVGHGHHRATIQADDGEGAAMRPGGGASPTLRGQSAPLGPTARQRMVDAAKARSVR